jgi:hypothetical protein
MSRKQKQSWINVVLVLLIVLDVISLIIVFNRMSAYSSSQIKSNIFLNERNQNSSLKISKKDTEQLQENGNEEEQKKTEVKVYDENTVWKTETKVDIFRLRYDNENGEITVDGKTTNKDKLLAPGTRNEYSFTVENTGDHTLSYTMEMEAYFGDKTYKIPVKARVWDYQKKYLLGGKHSMESIMKLNDVKEKAALGSGRYAVYTLEWEWPFERNEDKFDTMLGNLAVDKDLTLTIKIKTTAMWDANVADAKKGILSPKTGQDQVMFYSLLAVLVISIYFAIRGFFIVFVLKDSDREKEEEKDEKEQSTAEMG